MFSPFKITNILSFLFFLIMCVCVVFIHVCVWPHVHTWVYLHMCACMWKYDDQCLTLICFLNHSPPYSLRRGLSVKWELPNKASLSSQIALWIFCIHLPRLGFQVGHHAYLVFDWVLRIWMPVLLLAHQTLSSLIHFPSPTIMF